MGTGRQAAWKEAGRVRPAAFPTEVVAPGPPSPHMPRHRPITADTQEPLAGWLLGCCAPPPPPPRPAAEPQPPPAMKRALTPCSRLQQGCAEGGAHQGQQGCAGGGGRTRVGREQSRPSEASNLNPWQQGVGREQSRPPPAAERQQGREPSQPASQPCCAVQPQGQYPPPQPPSGDSQRIPGGARGARDPLVPSLAVAGLLTAGTRSSSEPQRQCSAPSLPLQQQHTRAGRRAL